MQSTSVWSDSIVVKGSRRLVLKGQWAMLRPRNHYSPRTHVFPADFPERLERFKEESGLSWAEIARRLETHPVTIRRWRFKGVQPNVAHQTALLELADSLGLGRLFDGGAGTSER